MPLVSGARDACGVFGIFAPDEDVARLTFFGLHSLQHRGQEAAGMAVAGGPGLRVHKGMGLVSQVFDEAVLGPLAGQAAIGHCRYSTTGSSSLSNAQPFYLDTSLGPIAVAHNGNLTNAHLLRRELLERGVGLISSSDSEVITQLLASPDGGRTFLERIRGFMGRAMGAYSLTILTREAVYGVRDPWGFRPLCLGRLDGGWVLASESCALDPIGARFEREVEPGEIVRLDASGQASLVGREPERPAFCMFEFVYFARPDSRLRDRTVHRVRQEMGRILAREHPVEADIVIGVPDSGTPAAIGYAHASGIPLNEGFTKNRYIARTFIQPDQRMRQAGIAMKYNPLLENVRGMRVVVVDDSIVRGNTSRAIGRLLRQAGAAEVHLRVSCPPIRHPCFMGIDFPTYQELVANRFSPEELARALELDSLGHLSMEGMVEATRRSGFCLACFSGDYPVPVQLGLDKATFEGDGVGPVREQPVREQPAPEARS